MADRLAGSASPYLRQHAGNPVDWYPWGAEAFGRARELNRPVLLSIGYSACHWCHVMARESFSDPLTAELMNSGFINVKVDREERPDVDAVYMAALQALTGAGGWPLTAVLTPEGEPFFAGTYWPKEARHGLPAFRDVLQAVLRAWVDNRDEVLATAADLSSHLKGQVQAGLRRSPVQAGVLAGALERLLGALDPRNGGFGTSPKFPPHSVLRFLFARPEPAAREAALLTVSNMARGGIFDQLAGGLARYTTDDAWTIPHFEKMLFDSAQFLGASATAWSLTGAPGFRRAVRLTADWLSRHLRAPDGRFMTALSAESGGSEGEHYLWEAGGFRRALASAGLSGYGEAAFGVTAAGNFEGRNVLTLSSAAWDEADDPRLEEARTTLLKVRSERELPELDDKILTGWNGLTISNLSLAGRLLDDPELLELARAAAAAFLPELTRGRLRHSSSGGPLLLEDLAHLGNGLLELYQADLSPELFTGAARAARQIAHDFSSGGQLFSTGAESSDLLFRNRELADAGAPADVAEAARLLLRIGRLTGDDGLLDLAEASLETAAPLVLQQPTLLGSSLAAMDEWLAPVTEVALAGERGGAALQQLARTAAGRFLPHTLIVHESAGALPVFEGRSAGGAPAVAWVCHDRSCFLPVTEPAQLAAQLPGGSTDGR